MFLLLSLPVAAQHNSNARLPDTAGSNSDLMFNTDFHALFDDSDLFASASRSPGRFRFQLDHQLTTHLNRHSISGAQAPPDIRKRGVEVHRLELDVRYQNPFASGWLLQGSAKLKAWLPGDYEYDNPWRDDYEWRLDELFIQRSSSHSSLSFGRQTIVWGEVIGNSVLDVINTTEYRDLNIIDIEEARLNQWLLVWDMFGDNSSWSSFINLYPEFNPVPVVGSPLFPKAPSLDGINSLRLPYYRRDKSIFEIGTRWNKSFSGSDVAVMVAHLYENALRFRLPVDGSNRGEPVINDFLLAGLSVNRAMGKLLLVLDVAWSEGILGETFHRVPQADGSSIMLPAFEQRDRLGISTGFEYAISPSRKLSLGITAQRDYGSDFSGEWSASSPAPDDISGSVLMRYSSHLRNDDLVLSATLAAQLEGGAQLLYLAADYRLNDDWLIGSQLVFTQGSPGHLLHPLHEDVRAGITISWNF